RQAQDTFRWAILAVPARSRSYDGDSTSPIHPYRAARAHRSHFAPRALHTATRRHACRGSRDNRAHKLRAERSRTVSRNMPRLGGSDLPESQPPGNRPAAFPDCSIHIRPRTSANRYTESLPSNKFVASYDARRFQQALVLSRDGKNVSTHAARERKPHRRCPACTPQIGPAVSSGPAIPGLEVLSEAPGMRLLQFSQN